MSKRQRNDAICDKTVRLRGNQFVAYRGPRGGITVGTVTSIWQLPQHDWWYGNITLSRRNNGVKYCNGIIPTRLAKRNKRLWRDGHINRPNDRTERRDGPPLTNDNNQTVNGPSRSLK